jgi:DNA-directed RNA polymerase omega subunit
MKDIISLPMEAPGPNVDSKYRLCVIAAQRALQIIKGSAPRVDVPYHKPTSVALEEVQEGLVPFAIDDAAYKAREDDEATFKAVLTETRNAYEDEDGNPLFSQPPAQAAPVPAAKPKPKPKPKPSA